MVRSASKIVESEASGEAQAQHREGSIQFETETAAVDASPEGQPGATTRSVTLGAKNEITADSINDLELGAPPPWRALPRISPPTGPPMATGVGGFNIERPIPRAGHAEGEVTWRRGDAERCHNRACAQASIRAQRMAVSVDTRESSAISRALAVIGIVGVILLMFWDKTREQLNDMLEAATRSYNVLSATTSARQSRLVIENQRGFANEPLPLGISVKDGLGVEAVIVMGLANGIELSLGTSQGSAGWLVSARDLDSTFIGTPPDFVGVMDATVTLRSPLGERLDHQLIRFEWVKKNSMPTLAPAAGPSPGLPPLDREEVARLVKLGRDLLKRGDVESARFLLRRAAIAGDAQAALELGLTFDGTQSGVRDIGSDVGQAREWYEAAIKLGSTEALRHLDRLARRSIPK